jgi:hypothetical protein
VNAVVDPLSPLGVAIDRTPLSQTGMLGWIWEARARRA